MSQQKPPTSLVFDKVMLKQFINGQLEPDVEEQVAAYLENRPELLAKVAAISGDGFTKRLKDAKQRSVISHSRIEPQALAANRIEPTALAAGRVESVAERQQTQVAGLTNQNAIATQPIEFPGYEIVKELGRGGMGVVYLAKNIEMDRLEVLKVLSDRLLNHPGAEQRFKQEIRAVSRLNHPNIVTSYNFLRTPSQMAFAMEYVHGMDLHKFIYKQQILPVGLACSLARQIAAGLQHAHEKGLVHRDIKPSNAMLYKSDGQLLVKILDFGLAKATSEKTTSGLTQDGTMLGTPEYMAPEQMLNAAKADIRADIYSLGCTLYHMLAGKAPYGGTQGEIMMAHAQADAVMVNLVRPHVPVELAAIIAKMMAKDPNKRFQTPAQVSAALQHFLNHPEVTTDLDDASVRSAADTIHEPNIFEQDTSVEIVQPVPNVVASIEPVSLPNQFVDLVVNPKYGAAPPGQRRYQTKGKKKKTQWWKHIVASGLLLVGLGLWQMGYFGFVFNTPEGTIVIADMPQGAEVLVDGKKLEVVWNAGKDKAQVSIAPGNHQLQVINQGNEILGQSVTIRGGAETVLKLVFKGPANPPTRSQNKNAEAANERSTELSAKPIGPLKEGPSLVPQPEKMDGATKAVIVTVAEPSQWNAAKTVLAVGAGLNVDFDAQADVSITGLNQLENISFRIRKVFFDGNKFSNEALQSLSGLSNIRELHFTSFWNVDISAESFASINSLTDLETLHFNVASSVNDITLGQLTQLKKLRSLMLWSTWVSDDGLSLLNNFPSLESARIENAEITGEGIFALDKLTNLRCVKLSHNKKLSENTLSHVKALPLVTEWWFPGSSITDAGLAHLRGLNHIRFLYLDDTNVSDAGLLELQSLTGLEKLFIYKTKVTEEGVITLHKALPNCVIESDYPLPLAGPIYRTSFQGHHYAMLIEPRRWEVAKDRCKQLGGYLATLDSNEEQNFLLSVLQKYSGNRWIGGQFDKTKNAWVWQDGRKITDQAILDKMDSGGVEPFLEFWVQEKRWNDTSDHPFPALCEWENAAAADEALQKFANVLVIDENLEIVKQPSQANPANVSIAMPDQIEAGLEIYRKSLSAVAGKADRELTALQANLRKSPSQKNQSFIERIERDRISMKQAYDFPLYLSQSLLNQVVSSRDKYRRIVIGVRDQYVKVAKGNDDKRTKDVVQILETFEGEISGLFERMATAPSIEKKGNWIVGSDEIQVEAPRDDEAYLHFGNPKWTDYSFEAEVLMMNQGTITMATRKTGDFRWAFDIGGWGNKNNLDLLPFSKGADAFKDRGRRWMPNRANIELGQWSKFRVEHAADIVKVFYNDDEVTSSEHPNLQNGRVGFYVHKGTMAKFRNIKVIGKNGMVLWRDWLPSADGR